MSNFFIPEPCHENWNKMTPQEQGRHCAVCSKVVVDFTQKKEKEINHIMATAEGRVCGNFNVSQLNQEAQMKVFKNPKNIFSKNIKYFAIAIFGFFAMSKKAEAQKLKGKVAIRGDVMPYDYHDAYTETTVLSGAISSVDDKHLSGAVVEVYSGEKLVGNATSIANGSYRIVIEPGKIQSRKITVRVFHPNYESKNINDLVVDKANIRLNVNLDEYMMLMGIVAYVPEDTVKVQIIEPVIDTTPVVPDTTLNKEIMIKGEVQMINPFPADTNTPVICTETYEVKDTTTTSNENKDPQIDVTNLVVRPEDIAIVYPNPTGTKATIYCNRQDDYKVELYNENGSLLQRFNFNGAKTEVDVSTYQRGNYIVKVVGTQDNNSTLKLIKQ